MSAGVVWIGDPGERRTIGRAELDTAVDRLASAWKSRTADAVTILLGPVPELVIGVLACGRAGVAATLVHPMTKDTALSEAIGGSRILLTSSAAMYRGELHLLKERVDDALMGVTSVEMVVVADRTGWMPLGPTLDVYHETPMRPGRDVWFQDIAGDIDGTDHPGELVETPSLKTIVTDPSSLLLAPATDQTLFLYEGHLGPDDADRARAAYVGASGTSLGSRPGGRLS